MKYFNKIDSNINKNKNTLIREIRNIIYNNDVLYIKIDFDYEMFYTQFRLVLRLRSLSSKEFEPKIKKIIEKILKKLDTRLGDGDYLLNKNNSDSSCVFEISPSLNSIVLVVPSNKECTKTAIELDIMLYDTENKVKKIMDRLFPILTKIINNKISNDNNNLLILANMIQNGSIENENIDSDIFNELDIIFDKYNLF